MKNAGWLAGTLVVIFAGSTKAVDDSWSPGAKPSPWDQIEALQRYPFYDAEPTVDWATALRHEHPLVRASAAIAIGRNKPAAIDPVASVGPLLRDDVATVRNAALWTLARWPTPQCRALALEIVRKWDRLADSGGGWGAQFNTRVERFLVGSGLPSGLTEMPLGRRVAWAKEWDAVSPPVNAPATQPEASPASITDVRGCLERSVLAVGDACRMKLEIDPGNSRFSRSLPGAETFARLARADEDPDGGSPATGPSFPLPTAAPRSGGGLRSARTQPSHGTVPGRQQVLSVETTPSGIEAPDIYVLYGQATHPLFIRVTRTREAEQRADRLLAELKASAGASEPSAQTVAELGKQRVQAAGPLFVALLARTSRTYPGTAGAEALRLLPRVAGPSQLRAILDLANDRSGEFLMYAGPIAGSSNAARAEYAKVVLNWRDEWAAGHIRQLALCVGWLGSAPPPEVADAEKAMLPEVVTKYVDAQATMLAGDARTRQVRAEEAAKLTPLLRALFRSMAPRDPDEAARVIGRLCAGAQKLYDAASKDVPEEDRRRQMAAYMVLQFLDLTPQWDEPSGLLRGVWALCQARQPGTDLIRVRVIEAISRGEPDALDLLPKVPADSAEVLAVILAGQRLGQTAEALARAQAFLRASPNAELTPELHMRLAALLYERGNYADALTHVKGVGDAFTNSREMAQVHCLRAQCLLALGQVDQAAAAFQAMRDRRKASQTETDRGDTRTFIYMDDRLVPMGVEEPGRNGDALKTWPRIPGGWVRRQAPGPKLGHERLIAEREGIVFLVGEKQRLLAWDGENLDSEYRFGVLPAKPVALAPLSAKEVFVALEDDTARLYRLGQSAPVWSVPLPLGKQRYVCASPSLILAADEARTLHALAPGNGRILWSHSIKPGRLRSTSYPVDGLLNQHGSYLLLVPKNDGITAQVEAVETANGTSLWTHAVALQPRKAEGKSGGRAELHDLAFLGDDRVIVAGEQIVTALRLSDHAELWSQTLTPPGRRPWGAAVRVTDSAVIWAGRNLLARLDSASGTIRWTCEWKPAFKPDLRDRTSRELADFPPTLCVTRSHVTWLVGSELLVVELATGKIVLQQPVFEFGMGRPVPVFVRGDRLHFGTQDWRLPMLTSAAASQAASNR